MAVCERGYLAATGVVAHFGDPAKRSGDCGYPGADGDRTAPMPGCCAALLLEGRVPRVVDSAPARCARVRGLGRLYCTLMDERRAWRRRIHAQYSTTCPPMNQRCCRRPAADALASAELSAAGRQYIDTALRRIDKLTTKIDPLRTRFVELRPTPTSLSGAAGAPVRHRVVMRGDHLGRDRRCAPVRPLR